MGMQISKILALNSTGKSPNVFNQKKNKIKIRGQKLHHRDVFLEGDLNCLKKKKSQVQWCTPVNPAI